jgi:hypothetical protein
MGWDGTGVIIYPHNTSRLETTYRDTPTQQAPRLPLIRHRRNTQSPISAQRTIFYITMIRHFTSHIIMTSRCSNSQLPRARRRQCSFNPSIQFSIDSSLPLPAAICLSSPAPDSVPFDAVRDSGTSVHKQHTYPSKSKMQMRAQNARGISGQYAESAPRSILKRPSSLSNYWLAQIRSTFDPLLPWIGWEGNTQVDLYAPRDPSLAFSNNSLQV